MTRSERALQERQAAFAEIVKELAAEDDLDRLFARIGERVCRLLGTDSASFSVVEGDELVFRGAYGVPEPLRHTQRRKITQTRVGRVILTRRASAIPDMTRDPHWRDSEVVTRWGYRAILEVPVVLRGEVIGALAALDKAPRDFSEEDIALLGALADHTALALDRTRLLREAQERQHEAEVLAELARAITASLDLDTVLERVAKGARELCRSDTAKIALRDPDSDAMVLRYPLGTRYPQYDTSRIEAGKGSGGLVVATGCPFRTDDYAADPRIGKDCLEGARVEGIVAELVMPIQIEGRVEGLLFVQNRAPRPFTERDEAVLLRLAGHAAIAIQNARLFGETERRRQTAEGLAQLGRLISQSLDPEEVAQRITDSVRALLGGINAVLFRIEPESGELVSVAIAGDVGPTGGGALVHPRESGLAGVAVRERRPVVTANLLADPRVTLAPEVRAGFEEAPFRAALSVPLLVKDRVIGALSIGDREGRTFGAEEIRLAQAFADQAAIALENSRLYGELRAALEEVEASHERIVQAERLRALGEMAGGIAHDFNNALAAILGRAQLLLARVEDPNFRRQLQVIEKVAMEAGQTVRRIQEFTRMRRARPSQPVDLARAVQEAVEFTRARWVDEAQAKGITYEVRVEGGPVPPVAGDPDELREALTNLVLNALDAMPEGGRVTIRTGVEGERVCCVVSDTGIGMTEEVRRRVFDPFFTTKGFRGTGLGLSMVYGIVTRHGGEVEVRSQPGQGSAFTLWLPAAREAAPPPERPAEAAPRPLRSARVLVIDDEEEIREVLVELLRGQGHAVVGCADGRSGLARFEAERFDLVITDLGMPGLSGWEVAAAVKRRSPALPVALITGWGDRIDPEEARAKGVDHLVAKPFRIEEIAALAARAVSPTTLSGV